MKLFKTWILIWSEHDPKTDAHPDSDYDSLAQLAISACVGNSYCSEMDVTEVADAKADPEWDGTEFFDAHGDPELGICADGDEHTFGPADLEPHA